MEPRQQSPIYTFRLFAKKKKYKKKSFICSVIFFLFLFFPLNCCVVFFLTAPSENHLVRAKKKNKTLVNREKKTEQPSFRPSGSRCIRNGGGKTSVVSMKLFRCLYFILTKCQVLVFRDPLCCCRLDINQFLHVPEEGAGERTDLDCFY